MRARLSKLNKPFLTFLACVAIAYGMWVLHWVKAAGKELPVALEWVLGDDITDEKPRYKVEAELEQYLTNFVALAELRGIDLSYVYSQNITIVWEVAINNNSTNVATSYGRGSDEIIIVVNKERFMARTEEGKKYVMYHEFGHDILNFKHLEGSDRGMMEPTAYTGFFKSYVRFNQERQRNYLYTSLNTMFERFNGRGDGISDEPHGPSTPIDMEFLMDFELDLIRLSWPDFEYVKYSTRTGETLYRYTKRYIKDGKLFEVIYGFWYKNQKVQSFFKYVDGAGSESVYWSTYRMAITQWGSGSDGQCVSCPQTHRWFFEYEGNLYEANLSWSKYGSVDTTRISVRPVK